MPEAERQVTRHFAEGHVVGVSFVVVGFVSTEFAVDTPAGLDAPSVVGIAQFEAAGLHDRIVSIALARDHRRGRGHVPVVRQVLIGDSDGIGRQRGILIGCGESLQQP